MQKYTSHNLLYIAIILAIGISSCSKPAGEGGTSRIKGKIYIRDYNSTFTILQDQFYAMEERVYIIYGDNDFYDDDIRTSYDGTYVFDNLRKGTYSVFAYSDDSTFTAPGGMYPVIQTVEITEEYQTIEVPTIILLK
jgi:hypothetical protein